MSSTVFLLHCLSHPPFPYSQTSQSWLMLCGNPSMNHNRNQAKMFNMFLMVAHYSIHGLYLSIYPLVMDRRGATGVLATNSLHFSRLSAFLKVSLRCNPVHSFILSSHLFFCLPLFLPPGTVPCSMVFASPDDLVTCPYHFSFRCLTVVRRSS